MIVVDASAVLAVLFDEPGAAVAIAESRGALLSAVNLDEVLHKSVRRHLPTPEVRQLLRRLELVIRPFDAEQAIVSADLHPKLRGTDTSFADRACLSLAIIEGALLVSADTKWQDLGLPINLRLIR